MKKSEASRSAKNIHNLKMITVATADGTILDFGDAIEEPGQIVVGTRATLNERPATGEYVLNDGKTLIFVDGTITKILEPSPVLALMTAMKNLAADFKSWKALMMPGEAKKNNHRKLWKEGKNRFNNGNIEL